MLVQIRVFRNSDCLANNNPCVRESVEVEELHSFKFESLVDSFKFLWPECLITFNI